MEAVQKFCPEILKWVIQIYSHESVMFAGNETFVCTTGVQQGDPLGPMLFSLAIHQMVKKVSQEISGLDLNAWYLDDGTIIGPLPLLFKALDLIKVESLKVDLKLNLTNCEIWWPTLNKAEVQEDYGSKAWDITLSNDAGTELLGSCIGSESA